MNQEKNEIIQEVSSKLSDSQNKSELTSIISELYDQKEELSQKLKKEKFNLQQRNHELSVLYHTSSALNYSLNMSEIKKILMDSLYTVLQYDFCSIYLQDFSDQEEFHYRNSPHLPQNSIKSTIENIYHAIECFTQNKIDTQSIKISDETIPTDDALQIEKDDFEHVSFVNIPLTFKGSIKGVLSIYRLKEKAFSREKINFAYTIANQISTIMARLKQLIENEKQRITHFVDHLQDAVVVIGKNKKLISINLQAKIILGLHIDTSTKDLFKKLKDIGIDQLVEDSISEKEIISSKEVNITIGKKENTFLANIDPIPSGKENFISGSVIILRDISYLKKIEKEKTKKIAVINKARELINSIGNQQNLFSILGDYILNVANAHMGALFLLERENLAIKSSWVLPSEDSTAYISELEANFPDSLEYINIQKGKRLLSHAMTIPECVVLKDFELKKNFLMLEENDVSAEDEETDIILKNLITIPLLTKEKTIGMLILIKKEEEESQAISKDDIETLETIASLAASALENAKLVQKTLQEQKIHQELKVAHEIQSRILPKKLPQAKNFDFGGISIPAHGIGGDYYDFFSINRAEDHLIGVALVDVIGKGIPAALITIMLKSILQMSVTDQNSAKEVIESINTTVLNESAISKFVPMFYTIIDDDTRVVKYTNAGHEMPLYYKAREDDFEKLDTDGFPVGGFEDVDYEEKTIMMEPGSIICMATDGIVEARNPEGEDFGEDRFKSIIKKYRHLPANKIVDKIYTHVTDFIKDAPQHDDFTVVVIKSKEEMGPNSSISSNVIWEQSIDVTSDTKYVKVVRDIVGEGTSKLNFDESTVYDLKLAVNEAHANIIRHAYMNEKNQPISFKITVYEDRVVYNFKDKGKTFGELAIKQTRSLDDFQGNGLGVFLIKRVMDDVTYDITPGEGTELTMVKFNDTDNL